MRCLLARVGGDNHWQPHIFPGFQPHSPRLPAGLSGEGVVSATPSQAAQDQGTWMPKSSATDIRQGRPMYAQGP